MKSRILSIALAGAALARVAFADAAQFSYSARNYVQDGLVGLYDAIENAGWDTHDASATSWKNLVGTSVMGDLDVTNLKSHSWGDAALTLTSNWDKVNPDGMLITDESVTLSAFTIETAVKSPADGNVRRWESFPWTVAFETWTSGNAGECYMERINGTRISACKTRMKNAEMAFSTVYDSLQHVARAFADGVEYEAGATVANYSYSGRLAFFSAMNNAQGHVIRVYNRVLSAEEVRLNNVLDQLRFQGKTVETVALPEGWAFDAAGVLRTASGKVLLRPDGAAAERAIVYADYETEGGSVVCTVEFEEGAAGVTNALYLAWGDADMGEDVRDWPQVRRIANVPPDVTELAFAVPPVCVAYSPGVATRLFLGESVRPYDYRVAAVGARGAQYLVTDYYANPKTVVDCEVELFDLTLQQRPFGADSDDTANAFSCSVYINGGGMWAFSSQDGKGQWQWSNCRAKTERTRFVLDVTNGALTVCSPTYAGWRTGTAVKRTKTSTEPIVLCANRYGAQGVLQDALFYGATISEDGEVLRDYVPCVVGGRAALYDAVDDVVHFSSSGTDFLESGANVDAGVTSGETPSSSYAAGTLPNTLFIVDTESTTRTIDTQLVYTDGGRKFGRAPLVLTNAGNDFGGTFTVEEGALVANFGAGLAATDHLALTGGLWALPGGTAAATVGVGAGEVSLSGARAGFGAYGADVTLRLGRSGSDGVVYPSENFSPDKLVLNDAYCANTLSIDSPISVPDETTTLPVEVGGGTAVLLKPVDACMMKKTGAGRLEFAATGNSVSNLVVAEGALALTPGSEIDVWRSGGILDVAPPSGTLLAKDAKITGQGVLLSEQSGNGTVTIDGATVDIQRIQIGGSQNGRMVVTNDASVTLNQFDGGNGSVWQYGGRVCTTNGVTGDVNFGCWGNSTFNYYLYGGTFERVKAGGNFQLGRNKNGVGNMYVEREGQLVTHCEFPSIGRHQGGFGNLYVRNGGRVACDFTAGSKIAKMCVADEGSGYLEIASDGEVDVAGWVQMANGYGDEDLHKAREGEVRLLAGGTLKASGLVRSDSNHKRTTLVFDGGRWVVNGTPQKPFISQYLTEAFVGTSGGVFDTAGYDVEFVKPFAAWTNQVWTQPATAAQIASCAAFTKAGLGTLTFNAANTYAAATCVSNGTLATAAAGALPSGGLLKLAGGAVDLKGTTQTVAMLAGFGQVANGTLAVTGAVWPGLGAEGGTLALNGTSASFTKLSYSLAKGEDGQVVCGRLTSDGAIDLSGVEISIDGIENMGERQVVLAEAASITGRPTCSLPSPFSLVKSATRLSLSPMTGTLLIFR